MEITRRKIARNVRALRVERGWSQAELAERLGLSQSRLSQVERGDGSFTAEQLVQLLRIFNVPLSRFVGVQANDGEASLQNALARLGARHLRESPEALVSERHEDVTLVVRDALTSGSPRLIAAVAPLVVEQIATLRLDKLRAALAEGGLDVRLRWLLENIQAALRTATEQTSGRNLLRRYRRALVVLDAFLDGSPPRQTATGRDVLDTDIRGRKSLEDTWNAASAISKRWNIVTALQPDDFRRALQEAHVTD